MQYTFNEVIGLPDKFNERSKLQCFNDEPKHEYMDNTIYVTLREQKLTNLLFLIYFLPN